jgi:CubicO group peptidase (beta-lactamase class C family)
MSSGILYDFLVGDPKSSRMSADDQTFLDALNAVPRQMQGLANDVAEIIEAHIDHVAQVLKDNLNNTQWIPESVRPKPPPPPPAPVIFAPESLYGRVQDWVMKNKVVTGTCVVGLGVSIYFIKRQRSLYLKKRRANRASNGARMEAVVVAGSITEPIVRSLALDLERRGFIVFVVCNDVEEELMVQSQERSDIRPLMIDLSDVSIDRFSFITYC